MKRYFFLFLSILLMLFALPKQGRVNSLSGMELAVLKKACSAKRLVKRTCAKKCLRHQTHSQHQDTAGITTDCSTPAFAVLFTQEQEVPLSFPLMRAAMVTATKRYLSPHLETDPDPPRFS